jgi:hypothetical protein
MNWNACLIFLARFAKTEFTAIPTRRILHIRNGCIATSIPDLAVYVAICIVSPATLCRSILLPLLACSPGLAEKIVSNPSQAIISHYASVRNMISSDQEPNQKAYRDFQRHVDRLCVLIVASDCSDREIDIERLHLRVQAATLFPEKMELYDMIYESRFRRLRQQFRERA